MEAVREVTIWDLNFQPNHIYLLDGDRIIAYIPKGSTEVRVSKSGKIKLDRRGRKFEQADISLFDGVKNSTNTIIVQGSKGKTYTVDPDANTCTCPGFTYRGTCKHLTALAA